MNTLSPYQVWYSLIIYFIWYNIISWNSMCYYANFIHLECNFKTFFSKLLCVCVFFLHIFRPHFHYSYSSFSFFWQTYIQSQWQIDDVAIVNDKCGLQSHWCNSSFLRVSIQFRRCSERATLLKYRKLNRIAAHSGHHKKTAILYIRGDCHQDSMNSIQVHRSAKMLVALTLFLCMYV